MKRVHYMNCPSCNGTISFLLKERIKAKFSEAMGVIDIEVPGLYRLWNSCSNPKCKWSKI